MKELNSYEDLQKDIAFDKKFKETNKQFVQIYHHAMPFLLDLTPLAQSVLIFFLMEMESNNILLIRNTELQEIFRRQKRQILNIIKELKSHNILTIIKFGSRNAFFINPAVSCCVGAQYKRKLLNAYENYAGRCSFPAPEANRIDHKAYAKYKVNKLKPKYDFYKSHPELQKPTEDEEKADKALKVTQHRDELRNLLEEEIISKYHRWLEEHKEDEDAKQFQQEIQSLEANIAHIGSDSGYDYFNALEIFIKQLALRMKDYAD